MKTILRLAALAGALCLGFPLCARPFTIDDMLNAEAFGDVTVDSGGHWLVYAVERPLSEAPRIDYDAMEVIRSRLFVADLDHPKPGRPLDPTDQTSGMVVYGFSPKGTRLAVGRLAGQVWQLGVVTMATGTILWTDVSPEYDPYQTMLGWTSEEAIAAIAVGDGRLPFWLRADHSLFEDLATNWHRHEAGREPSVTVVGSGRLVEATPQAADRRLILVDAITGRSQWLATGDFRSLTLSPDRRMAAVSEQTGAISLVADQPLAETDQTRRHRLVLFNLQTVHREDVCATCDIRTSKPVWRPDGGALLFGGGGDDQPAASLTAWSFTLAPHALERVLPKGLMMTDPVLAQGPSELALGWSDGQPLLFARATTAPSARLDWYRVSGGAPQCLTCTLGDAGPRLIQTDHDEPVMVSGDHGWRLGAGGATLALTGDDIREGPSGRSRHHLSGLISWRTSRGEIDVGIDGVKHRHVRLPALAGLSLLTASVSKERAFGLQRFADGKAQILALTHGARPVTIATINANLDALEQPEAVLLSHPLSDGTVAASWLLLPGGHRPGDKMPLIVIPYPGRLQSRAAPPRTPPDQCTDNPWPLLGHGYAVLLPDVPAVRAGSGGHYNFAVDILAAVDAAIATGRVDPDKLGLYGHSFGGLAAGIVATQTDRFKAVVASAGFYDLVSERGTFMPWTRLNPGQGQSIAALGGFIETFQPELGTTPWSDPAPYLAASSVFHSDRIRTPMLIQVGDADAASLQQGEELFSALYRQGKDAELLSYWGENHVLGSPANVRDFHERLFGWFDCHFDPEATGCGRAQAR